jgi:hypothetical protein
MKIYWAPWVVMTAGLTLLLAICFSVRDCVAQATPADKDLGFIDNDVGKPLHWGELPIRLVLDEAGPERFSAVAVAVHYLNDSIGRKAFVFDGVGQETFMFWFSAPECREKGECRAFTRLYSTSDGEIITAGVFIPLELDTEPHAWWVIAHELGHVLGLADDPAGFWSLMSGEMDLGGLFPPLTNADTVRLIVAY